MEYAVQSRISKEQVFVWWMYHVVKKRNQIIAKIKSKYWTRTHKLGTKVPEIIEMAEMYDTENGNNLWWDAILKEMANIILTFELFDIEEKKIPPGFQQFKPYDIRY